MQMGCSASKVDNEPIVLMCKERRHYLKQAMENRYAFAVAHEDYFRALSGMSIIIREFAEGDLILLSSSRDVHAPETSSPEKKSSDPLSVAPEKSSSTSSLHLHSDSHSHHTHSHSASPSGSSISSFHDDKQDLYEQDEFPPFHEDNHEFPPSYGSPHIYYMRSGPTSSQTFEEKLNSPSRVTWGTYSGSSQYGMDNFFGIPSRVPASSSPSPPGPSYSPNYRAPPPPSPPRSSAWDFFNPFVTLESGYPYDNRPKLGVASEGSSRSSSRIREEEGIPDLEDEDHSNHPKKKMQGENIAVEKAHASDSQTVKHPHEDGSVVETASETQAEQGNQAHYAPVADTLKKDKVVLESAIHLESKIGSTLEVQRNRNVLQVIKDMDIQFQRAQEAGKIVSDMLEPTKVPYHPRFSLFKVISASVLSAFSWNQSKASGPTLSKEPQLSTSENNMAAFMDPFPEDSAMSSGSHSSTLDKIYVWEKKLCKEIKISEKMRIEYDKIHIQMAQHRSKWENSNQMGAKRIAMKSLETKMKVAFQVVDSISKRIHNLRDEELQPQIIELIEGLSRMCRQMLDCYQLQIQILSQTKFIGYRIFNEPYQRATMHLERQLQIWHLGFENWFGAQKAYIQSLNGWLLKCILYEPEETADGVIPFSPRRVGAPSIFVICNDWSQALEDLPASIVTNSFDTFMEQVKQAARKQDDEQLRRSKAEFPPKDLEKLDKKFGLDIDKGQNSSTFSDQKQTLDSSGKFVEQENTKHEKLGEEGHDWTFNDFQSGLKNVFEALTEFTAASLRVYEDIRKHCREENICLGKDKIS